MSSIEEAEKVALESLPDETTKIKNMNELKQYMGKGYTAKPLKMPVMLLTGKFRYGKDGNFTVSRLANNSRLRRNN